jgi:multidrug efflux pump subunit AcrB
MVLLLLSMSLVYFQYVAVKMLPFDNKSEFQVIIDMPEGTPLEQTARVAREMGSYLATVPEVTDFQPMLGRPHPTTFNGLVRNYYLRAGPKRCRHSGQPVSKDDAQNHKATLSPSAFDRRWSRLPNATTRISR